LFAPILIVFTSLARLITRTVGGEKERNPFTLREEILTMLQMSAVEGDIEPIEKMMIRRLFHFGETMVREIMVPLIDVVAIEGKATCGEASRLATEKAHKRLPVFDDRIDRVIGVVDTLEILGNEPNQPIAPYVRPVSYVPGAKSIRDLLLDMRRKCEAMVAVVDEFGGAEGIVTLEDIMEEVVEDLHDEFDVHEKPVEWIRKLGENDYLVSARIELDTLREHLAIDLPEGNYATLAGFLLEKSREVPSVGAEIPYKDILFSVHKGSARVIEEVRVRLGRAKRR
jgi:CBS domain containing-hemolysin-like protein